MPKTSVDFTIYNGIHTRVDSLKRLALKNPSKVSHQAVVLGAALMNKSRAKSKTPKSTAKEGSWGAQGKNPHCRSCNAGSLHVHRVIFSNSKHNVSEWPKRSKDTGKNQPTLKIYTSYIQ